MSNVTQLFKNVNIFRSADQPVINKGFIVVNNGKVAAIGNDLTSIQTHVDHEIDLHKQWIIPGIIDAHVHLLMNPEDPNANGRDPRLRQEDPIISSLRAVKHLKQFLRSGITYIRDAGGPTLANIAVRTCIRSEIVEGPGMITCGRTITITGGHAKQWGITADGVDEVRKAARTLILAGADLLKVTADGDTSARYMLSYDDIRTVVEQAHRAGKKVMAHTSRIAGIRDAVYAGVDSIEHAAELYQDDEVIKEMVKRGTYLVPTLTAYQSIISYEESKGHQAQRMYKPLANEIKSLQRAYHVGIPVAIGTDSGTIWNRHGQATIREIKLIADSGISPVDVLNSATKVGAQLLGIDDKYGSLEKGKFADFVVLNDSPLNNIDTLFHPVQVYKTGRLVN
ncbi:MAG: amidohydrolase family protein [Sporolactobacillus sp.]|nr:amidohydrolase family protein [Sporolactobacillus sp.]